MQAIKEFFLGGDSASPKPTLHTFLGFLRTTLLFVVVFVAQWGFDASTHAKDFGALNTYTDLWPILAYILLEIIWRVFRSFNSPLLPFIKMAEDMMAGKITASGGVAPTVPPEINLDLPTPPTS